MADTTTTSTSLPCLKRLHVNLNQSGWGPTSSSLTSCVPEEFLIKPFAPFSKSEKLGRIADFKRFGRDGRRRYGDFQKDENDPEDFSIVDTEKIQKRGSRHRRRQLGRGYQRRQRPRPKNANEQKKVPGQRVSGQSRFNRRRQRWRERLYKSKDTRSYQQYQSSVPVGTDWEVVEQFDLKELAKLSAPPPTKTEDIKWCGHLEYVDPTYDKITTQRKKALERITNRQFFYVTTTDDENIEDFARAGKGNVFATDAIMSHLMASTRSVIPWDIIVQRVGTGKNKTVFFDKREDNLDYLTVHETSNNPPDPEDTTSINGASKLSVEATTIRENFSQQILLRGGKRKDFEEENPFFDEDDAEGVEPAAVAYRYRCFHLGSDIRLVARTELHGITKRKERDLYVTSFAMNEWDATSAWRKRLDKQKGSIFASEAKNNSLKVAKWTIQTILSGAEFMKLGYVSRTNFKNRSNHQILGTQYVKPSVVSQLITLNERNIWAVMRHIIECCMKQPEGKYLILRDPNKPMLRLYKLPEGTFDDSDDESEESEESDGE